MMMVMMMMIIIDIIIIAVVVVVDDGFIILLLTLLSILCFTSFCFKHTLYIFKKGWGSVSSVSYYRSHSEQTIIAHACHGHTLQLSAGMPV